MSTKGFPCYFGDVPIYVYECQGCSQQWEYMQSVGEAPKTECEKCAGKLEKIIAPTAFVLKGGGWYKDLYSSSSSKSGGSSTGSGATETKSESKSESSTSTKSESSSSSTTSSSTSSSKKE